MIVIGITGGIGSGKTVFSGFLAELGVEVVDVDRLADRLLETHSVIRERIKDTFGSGVFDATGNLKRKILAGSAFSGKGGAKKLNRIFRPFLARAIQDAIAEGKEKGLGCIVFDMAVLFELRLQHCFNTVVVVLADESLRYQRIRESRDWDEEAIRNRMSAQISDEERVRKADVIVRNEGTLKALREEAVSFYETHIKA